MKCSQQTVRLKKIADNVVATFFICIFTPFTDRNRIMKKIALLLAAVLTTFTSVSAADLVTLPQSAITMDYTLTGTYISSNGDRKTYKTIKVSFYLNDVYVQGLAYFFPNALVKGTLNGSGQVVFKSGQYVGTDEYGEEFIVGRSEEGGTTQIKDIVFNFYSDTKSFVLADGCDIVESSSTDIYGSVWSRFSSVSMKFGAYAPPPLVTLPDNAVTEDYTLKGNYDFGLGSEEIRKKVKVSFCGDDVYVEGLAYYSPNALLKGTKNSAGQYVFKSGQYVGTTDSGEMFVVGCSDDGGTTQVKDIVFNFDADSRSLILADGYYLAESSNTDINEHVWSNISSVIVYVSPKPVTIPEGLEPEFYFLTATEVDNDNEKPFSKQIKIGFDGNDVYFSCFFSGRDIENSWLKGTLSSNGKTVTIPSPQFMGTYAFLGYSFDYFATSVSSDLKKLTDIVLSYDAGNNTFSCNQYVVLNDSPDELSYYQMLKDVVVAKMNDIAATPAVPSVQSAMLTDVTYPKVLLDVPVVDVNGIPMDKTKLYYAIWVEKNGVQMPLVIKANEYIYFTEDMSEIPYVFDDNWDIYEGGSTFYLNQGEEEIASWTKIGVQSIYRGCGECHKSPIAWFGEPTPVGGLQWYYTTANTANTIDGATITVPQSDFPLCYAEDDYNTKLPKGSIVTVQFDENNTVNAVVDQTGGFELDISSIAAGTYQSVTFSTPGYASAVAKVVVESTNPTAVKPAGVANDGDAGVWYTLDGRRLYNTPTQKGIYIHNGRKVVIK